MKQPGRLLDCAGIARELGVSRTVAEKIMHRLPKIELPDVRKTYVRRADVDAYLSACTIASTGISRRGRT